MHMSLPCDKDILIVKIKLYNYYDVRVQLKLQAIKLILHFDLRIGLISGIVEF